jgi:mevalonate kinase
MKQTFYSNGKLLITGEYVVLDGAKALALPTKFGQDLVVVSSPQKTIQWKSLDADGSVWFETEISLEAIASKKLSEHPIENTLIEILHTASKMNPQFLSGEGHEVTTHLTFPKSWGLGTSSTLINNIAQWLDIDAFELLRESFGGSGYDIACAQNDTAIVYQIIDSKPVVEPVIFNPPFAEKLYFVYLNKKQSSKSAIASYNSKRKNLESVVPKIDALTEIILNAESLDEFVAAIEKHEEILSEILEIPTVTQSLFPDFNGTVKSLGAWGGDFILVAADENPSRYFAAKGFEVVVPFSEMIL